MFEIDLDAYAHGFGVDWTKINQYEMRYATQMEAIGAMEEACERGVIGHVTDQDKSVRLYLERIRARVEEMGASYCF